MDAREDLEQVFFCLQNWRNQMTEQIWNPSVFIGPAVILPDLSVGISFSLGDIM